MPIQFDTHVHSCFSTDSEILPEEHLKQAYSLGLSGLCFTDHMDYEFPLSAVKDLHTKDIIPFCFDWESYVNKIRNIKENSHISVYIGVECGLQKKNTVIKKNSALSKQDALDYLIGSLHLINEQDPYYPSFWEGKEPFQCIQYYFEEVYENLQYFHEIDSLGHLDYIIRYAPSDFVYIPSMFREILDAILEFLIKKDIALEINTAGYKKSGRFPNPHFDIVKWYCEKGGKLITIGSDAHSPEFLAYHFPETAMLIKKAGLCQYAIYQKRKPIFYDL